MEIKIPQINTSYMTIQKGSNHSITLLPKYLKYFAWSDCTYNETDEENQNIKTQKRLYNKENFPKEHISSISLYFDNTENLYCILISTNTSKILIHIQDRNHANSIFNQIQEWRYN